MFEKAKARLTSLNPIHIHNPFTFDERGEATHVRLGSLSPEEAQAEYKLLSEDAEKQYLSYVDAIDNREIAKNALGITLLGGLVTGAYVLITNNTDEDEDEYEEDEDDDNDDDNDDNDESE